jgi:hypothetical protein
MPSPQWECLQKGVLVCQQCNMDKKILITEGLDFNDMEGQVEPTVTVDEYAAKMGKDSDIVTLGFTVKSEQAGDDLVNWFERGYDWVLDASLSDGEVSIGKYLVFVEMNRRSTVPSRIVELLKDLKTLTGLKLTDWTVKIKDEDYEPDEQVLQQVIICNPAKYRIDKDREEELNEMRSIAGIKTKNIHPDSEYIRTIKNMAGL